MKAVIQRVSSAHVDVGGEITGSIGNGLLVLAGFEELDEDSDLSWVAGKICRLRIFSDSAGVMNLGVSEIQGDILAVSQFTLFASVKKGNRPSWNGAAPPHISRPLFTRFVAKLEEILGRPVPTGVFGADMQVHLINDGPVTIAIDSRAP